MTFLYSLISSIATAYMYTHGICCKMILSKNKLTFSMYL